MITIKTLCLVFLAILQIEAAFTSPKNQEYKTGRTMCIKWNAVAEWKDKFSFLSLAMNCQNGAVTLGMIDKIPADAEKYYWKVPYSLDPVNECTLSLQGHSESNVETLEQSVHFGIVKGSYVVALNEPVFDATNSTLNVSWDAPNEQLDGKYFALLMRKSRSKPVAFLEPNFYFNQGNQFAFNVSPELMQTDVKYYIAFVAKFHYIEYAYPEMSTKRVICTCLFKANAKSGEMTLVNVQPVPISMAVKTAQNSKNTVKAAKKKGGKGHKKSAKRGAKSKGKSHKKSTKKRKSTKAKRKQTKGIQSVKQVQGKNDTNRHRHSSSTSFSSWDSYSSSYSFDSSSTCCSSSSCCDPSSCYDPSSCCDPSSCSSCCSGSSRSSQSSESYASEEREDHRLVVPNPGTIFDNSSNNQTSFPNNAQSVPGNGAPMENEPNPGDVPPNDKPQGKPIMPDQGHNAPKQPLPPVNAAVSAKLAFPVAFGAAAFGIVLVANFI